MLLFRTESFTITGLCDMVFYFKFFCTLMRFDIHQYVNLCYNLEKQFVRTSNQHQLMSWSGTYINVETDAKRTIQAQKSTINEKSTIFVEIWWNFTKMTQTWVSQVGKVSSNFDKNWAFFINRTFWGLYCPFCISLYKYLLTFWSIS